MKLKQSDRTQMLADILRDAFAARFQKMHDDINDEFKKFVDDDHAAFIEALGDVNVAPYIAKGFGATCLLPHHKEEKYVEFCRPMWGLKTYLPDSSYCYHNRSNRIQLIISSDIVRPHFLTEFYSTLPDDYFKAWEDYTTAQPILSALLNGYTTVEKLLADFPEYKKYVPEIPPTKNLPVVMVGELRGQLSALGIPAE